MGALLDELVVRGRSKVYSSLWLDYSPEIRFLSTGCQGKPIWNRHFCLDGRRRWPWTGTVDNTRVSLQCGITWHRDSVSPCGERSSTLHRGCQQFGTTAFLGTAPFETRASQWTHNQGVHLSPLDVP